MVLSVAPAADNPDFWRGASAVKFSACCFVPRLKAAITLSQLSIAVVGFCCQSSGEHPEAGGDLWVFCREICRRRVSPTTATLTKSASNAPKNECRGHKVYDQAPEHV